MAHWIVPGEQSQSSAWFTGTVAQASWLQLGGSRGCSLCSHQGERESCCPSSSLPDPCPFFQELARDTARQQAPGDLYPARKSLRWRALKALTRPRRMPRQPSGSTAGPGWSVRFQSGTHVSFNEVSLYQSCIPLAHPHACPLLPGNPVITEPLHTFLFPRKIQSTGNTHCDFACFETKHKCFHATATVLKPEPVTEDYVLGILCVCTHGLPSFFQTSA